MTMRKALVAAVAIVLVAAAGAGAWVLTSTTRRATAVAATVNGEAITWAQVDAEIARAASQFGIDTSSPDFAKQRDEVTKAIVDQLVGVRIIMQEARERNLVVPESEVDKELAGIKARFASEDEFTTAMARNGFTLASLREVIRLNLTQRRVAEAVAPVTVTDAEVRAAFERDKARFDQPAQIRVGHILFRIADKEQESLARAKARIVQARLADGAKFEDLAKQYSDDPGSAQRGGDLGYVTRGTMVKEFEEAAWALQPGQTSGLVKTQYGLHIIRVQDVRPAREADLDKVKDAIREQLANEKRGKVFEAWVEARRKVAKIERFARP